MIGVAVQSSEREIASEFFELFKTPWEFWQAGRHYDVVLCTHDEWERGSADLVMRFGSERTRFDTQNQIAVRECEKGTSAIYGGQSFPIYGKALSFPKSAYCEVFEKSTRAPIVFLTRIKGRPVLRIGYDLFQEVKTLLSAGQPEANARIPSLELHIELLRDVITRSGIRLVEIPPIPEGHNLIACLTHDLDHPVLRNHCCDHTMFGFLYRATVGSLMHVCRGRKPVKNLYRNCAAVARLPFVYLGIAGDPWRRFDRYLDMERGMGSTYFVIPKKGYPGRRRNGPASPKRASRYSVKEIKSELEKVISAGCEVGLHGIDSWMDTDSGNAEREEVVRSLGTKEAGVRMHWLFFDEKSPVALDRAGFSYDSSFGYNGTVGYRAGTAQAYKPIGASHLLELPLHVMDTALFYPEYLNLSDVAAQEVVGGLVDQVTRFGGALTVNWHDRSIAPERLWDDFYTSLIGALKRQGAWLPTAAQAVSWFRKRRSAAFERVSVENGVAKIRVKGCEDFSLPGLRVRVHRPKTGSLFEPEPGRERKSFVEAGLKMNVEQTMSV